MSSSSPCSRLGSSQRWVSTAATVCLSLSVEPHQAVRQTVLLDVPDVPESRLLERTPGAAVPFLDGGDHCRNGDDRPCERGEDPRPEPLADQLFIADQD